MTPDEMQTAWDAHGDHHEAIVLTCAIEDCSWRHETDWGALASAPNVLSEAVAIYGEHYTNEHT